MKVSALPFSLLAVVIVVSALGGCVANSVREAYWVPLVSPDGLIYEVQILPEDFPGRVIICSPVEELVISCLGKSAEGYDYVLIQLPPA